MASTLGLESLSDIGQDGRLTTLSASGRSFSGEEIEMQSRGSYRASEMKGRPVRLYAPLESLRPILQELTSESIFDVDCQRRFDSVKLIKFCKEIPKIHTLHLTNLPSSWSEYHEKESRSMTQGSELINYCNEIQFLQFEEGVLLPVEEIRQAKGELKLDLTGYGANDDPAENSPVIEFFILARLILSNTQITSVQFNEFLPINLLPFRSNVMDDRKRDVEELEKWRYFEDRFYTKNHFIIVCLIGLKQCTYENLELRLEYRIIDQQGNRDRELLQSHDLLIDFYPRIIQKNPQLSIFNGININMIKNEKNVDLSGSKIGDSEVPVVMELLKSNRILERLNLSNNFITSAGFMEFFWCLHPNRQFQLKFLDVSNNWIREGAQKFVEQIREMKTTCHLRELNLNGNPLGKNTQGFLDVEKEIPTLKIHYSANKLLEAQQVLLRTERKIEPYLAIVTFFIDMVQFIAFPFILPIPWSTGANTNFIPQVVNLFAISQFDFTVGFAKKFWAVIIAVSFLFLSQNRLLYQLGHGFDYTIRFVMNETLQEIYIGVILQFWFSLFSTTLYVPVMRVLLSAVDCTYINETNGARLDSDPSFTCWTAPHVPIVLATFIAMPLYFFISIRISRVGGSIDRLKGPYWNWTEDELPDKKDFFFAATSLRSMLTRIISLVLLTPSIFLSRYPLPLVITYNFVALGLLILTVRSPPYYLWKANAVQFAAYCLALWTNFMALIVYVSATPYIPSLIYFSTFCPIFGLGFGFGWFYFNPHSKSCIKSLRPTNFSNNTQNNGNHNKYNRLLKVIRETEEIEKTLCVKMERMEIGLSIYYHIAVWILPLMMLWFGAICRFGGCTTISTSTTGLALFSMALLIIGSQVYSLFIAGFYKKGQRSEMCFLATCLSGVFGLSFFIFGILCYKDKIPSIGHCDMNGGIALIVLGPIFLVTCLLCLCLSIAIAHSSYKKEFVVTV